jgi:nicotinate phosphoribosyltransferase
MLTMHHGKALSALFTDLYEVSMAQAYMAENMSAIAVFETFFRKLPASRAYVLAAGVSSVLDFLEGFHFEKDDVEYLRGLNLFPDELVTRLPSVRFTGDVWAVPEGTVVFPNEPIVQVVAPIVEAQLVETLVLNQVHVQCVMASKAARVVDAAQGRPVVDFGSRRAHGVDAALEVARTSYLAGAAGTSNLLAAKTYGIQAFGTMAHSFVQAFDEELQAFETYARLYPGTTLLVDTYDTLRGVDRVIELAASLGTRFDVRAIRLDSGDLHALSTAARQRLDAAGLQRVEIFASSSLDEHQIAGLVAQGSPIDGYGVGTALAIAQDAPSLDMAYKLVEYDGIGRTKLSSDKVIYPGRKQVFRSVEHGVFAGDTIGQADEALPGEPLLVQVMKGGRRLSPGEQTLYDARARARMQVDALPRHLRALEPSGAAYPVGISRKVASALEELRRAYS